MILTVEEELTTSSEFVTESGCRIWTGSIKGNGYGQMRDKRYVHRATWELVNGPIPNGLQVCHKCDVRLCCNDAHLFLGTQLDNMRDANRKGRVNSPEQRKRQHGIMLGNQFARGYKQSAEQQLNRSLSQTGRHHSIKTREKMRASALLREQRKREGAA